MEEGSTRDYSREISDAGEGDMLLHPSSYPETPSSGYRVYKRRWLVLVVVALLNISNGMARNFIVDHSKTKFKPG